MSSKVYTIEEIKEILYNVLKNTVVKRAILFGSYAKNEATPKSDVDIVLESDGKLRGLDFFELIGLIAEALNKDVDVIERIEIIEGSRIEKEIENTGVLIYES